MNLEMRIGEIVVEGVAADRTRLSDSLERELRRLAHERGVPRGLRQDATIARLDAGALPGNGDALGTSLAGAIWKALDR